MLSKSNCIALLLGVEFALCWKQSVKKAAKNKRLH